MVFKSLAVVGVLVPWVVNVAAFRSATAARVARPIAFAGAIACAASFMILAGSSAKNDRTSLIVLVVLLATALIAEHRVLRHRRPRHVGGGCVGDSRLEPGV